MNKSELVRQLAERADLSRAEAAKAIDALFSVEDGIIAEALRGGDKVQLTGFGSFETKRREARKGRNPRTGKEIGIAASTSAGFRVGRSLKETLGGPKGPGEGMQRRGRLSDQIRPASSTHGPGEGM